MATRNSLNIRELLGEIFCFVIEHVFKFGHGLRINLGMTVGTIS